jgi:hypothetical protein
MSAGCAKRCETEHGRVGETVGFMEREGAQVREVLEGGRDGAGDFPEGGCEQTQCNQLQEEDKAGHTITKLTGNITRKVVSSGHADTTARSNASSARVLREP